MLLLAFIVVDGGDAVVVDVAVAVVVLCNTRVCSNRCFEAFVVCACMGHASPIGPISLSTSHKL